MIRTYRFKLYKSKRNRQLHTQINAAALVYNHCIALHKRYYRLFKKQLSVYTLQHHLVKLKKRFKYITEIGSQAIQDITERIDKAYKLFFRNLKVKVKTAPPSFKKISKYKSFTLKQAGYKFLDGNKLRIGKQIFKYFKSRELEGKIKTLTIKRDALGDIYIYIVCDVEQNEVLTRTGKSVGFDFGLKKFLTSSENDDVEAPLFFKKNANALKSASRKLSRKKKGSNNRRKAKIALARLHKKVANQRSDFHWQLAHEIVSKYATICIEDLNLKEMQKLYGKKISDLGFAEFVKILEYKASRVGSQVIKVDRFFASSQICHCCGYKNSQTKDLRIRKWVCNNCGIEHNRDRNAAINIKFEGERILNIA